MDFKLMKVSLRKNRKQNAWISFNQYKDQIALGTKISSKNEFFSKKILIKNKFFFVIIPLYDIEFKYRIKNLTKGFCLADIINIIVSLTIALYKMDIYLNPQYYRSCAKDVANSYSLSNLYKYRKGKKIIVWYHFDH